MRQLFYNKQTDKRFVIFEKCYDKNLLRDVILNLVENCSVYKTTMGMFWVSDLDQKTVVFCAPLKHPVGNLYINTVEILVYLYCNIYRNVILNTIKNFEKTQLELSKFDCLTDKLLYYIYFTASNLLNKNDISTVLYSAHLSRSFHEAHPFYKEKMLISQLIGQDCYFVSYKKLF